VFSGHPSRQHLTSESQTVPLRDSGRARASSCTEGK